MTNPLWSILLTLNNIKTKKKLSELYKDVKNNNDERVLIIVFVIIILLNYVYKNQKEKFEKKLHELNKEAKMK